MQVRQLVPSRPDRLTIRLQRHAAWLTFKSDLIRRYTIPRQPSKVVTRISYRVKTKTIGSLSGRVEVCAP